MNAASLAAIKAVDASGATVLGVITSADQTIGHTYQGMVISAIPTGMEVKTVSFSNGTTTVTYDGTTGKEWTEDHADVVKSDITITLDWMADYTDATLMATVAGLGTTTATGTNGTINANPALDYTVSELLAVLEKGLTKSVATVELKYGANFVDADSSLHFTNANKGSWTVIVTAGNGATSTTYLFA